MKHQETVIIIDFGGQYAQLIARRVRECGVYCEILPYNKPAEEILSHNPKGIIFSGGPASVNMKMPRSWMKAYSRQAYRFWESATVCSLWQKTLAARLPARKNMNTAIRNFTRMEAVRFLKTFQKRLLYG